MCEYRWSGCEGWCFQSLHQNTCNGKSNTRRLATHASINITLEFGGGEQLRHGKMREPDIHIYTLVWCWTSRRTPGRKQKHHRRLFGRSDLCVLSLGICWISVSSWIMLQILFPIASVRKDGNPTGQDLFHSISSCLMVSLFSQARSGIWNQQYRILH